MRLAPSISMGAMSCILHLDKCPPHLKFTHTSSHLIIIMVHYEGIKAGRRMHQAARIRRRRGGMTSLAMVEVVMPLDPPTATLFGLRLLLVMLQPFTFGRIAQRLFQGLFKVRFTCSIHIGVRGSEMNRVQPPFTGTLAWVMMINPFSGIETHSHDAALPRSCRPMLPEPCRRRKPR